MRPLVPLLLCGLLSATDSTVPEWVMAGIAAVETGSEYRGGRLIRYCDRRDGSSGEVGPWQLSPAVLRDLGAHHRRSHVRSDPLLAEELTRAWLQRCKADTDDWDAAVARYHVGPRGDARRGRAYAERVRAIGMRIVGSTD